MVLLLCTFGVNIRSVAEMATVLEAVVYLIGYNEKRHCSIKSRNEIAVIYFWMFLVVST